MADTKKTWTKRGSKEEAAPNKSSVPVRAKSAESMLDIDDLADRAGLKRWEKKALCQAAGWAPGKQVTGPVFDQALDKLRRRPIGGGKI
jgi:hypothetical protein